MTPTDAVLNEVRVLVARILDPDSESVDTGDAVRLAHLVVILDEAAGAGRLPSSWQTTREER